MIRYLAEKIFADCPLIFRDRGDDSHQNRIRNGFECGDGWFHIVYGLSNKIEAYATLLAQAGCSYHSVPVVLQVKERFGRLDYCLLNSTLKMEQLIQDAKNQSLYTCEMCSDEGLLRVDEVIAVLCDKCIEMTTIGDGQS